MAPATEKEVRAALFMIHPEKSPGPYGMTSLFFQKAWTTVKLDLMHLILSLLQEGSFDKRLNMTNISLIPKTERSIRMTELRPIHYKKTQQLLTVFPTDNILSGITNSVTSVGNM